MSDVIRLDDHRSPEMPRVEFSQCPHCLTFFGFTRNPECPACRKSWASLPSVDEELRIFIS